MKKPFTVAQYADEVTAEYIRNALEHCYYGTSYVNTFSDKLVRVLLSDYKKKIRNLGWFFKDEAGRVRNYVILQPSPERVFKDAVGNSQHLKDIVAWLKSVGATYSASDFIANKCLLNKQSIKITTAIRQRTLQIPYSSEAFNSEGNIKVNIKQKIDLVAFVNDFGSELSEVVKDFLLFDSLKFHFSAFGALVTAPGSTAVLALVPPRYIKLEIKDSLSSVSTDKLSTIFGNIGAESMKISMDLADMITSSTGNCSSCLSVDNIHHAGTIMSFRSDFSVIAFTNDANDRLKKHGRLWVYLRLTEDGFIRQLPFWKQQKSYGSVSTAHRTLLHDTIVEKVKTNLGLLEKDFKTNSNSIKKNQTSPNVSTMIDSHSAAPGYIDTGSEGQANWFIHHSGVERFERNMESPLTFPEMLTVDGETTNAVRFRDKFGSSSYYGALSSNIFEVTCSVTGKIVLASDAVEVDGQWISKDILGVLISSRTLPEKLEVSSGAILTVLAEDDDSFDEDDLDIEDF